ncbi:MAG: hypothetical protein K6T30_08310 [Alicyclobacillus sp.]|nr:hypothetical protein [Alicyclobacillus sp.]
MNTEQATLGIEVPVDLAKFDNNPMVRLHGYGPPNALCKSCKHIRRKTVYSGKHYYKCEYRGNTNGPGTDHRLKWRACALFEERQNGG